MKTFAKDLKTIYTAANEESARKQLEAVTRKWSGQYPSAMNRWNDNWDAISPIFKFSKEVRTAFYTTNLLLNKQWLNHRNLLLSRINYHRRSEFTEKISHRHR